MLQSISKYCNQLLSQSISKNCNQILFKSISKNCCQCLFQSFPRNYKIIFISEVFVKFDVWLMTLYILFVHKIFDLIFFLCLPNFNLVPQCTPSAQCLDSLGVPLIFLLPHQCQLLNPNTTMGSTRVLLLQGNNRTMSRSSSTQIQSTGSPSELFRSRRRTGMFSTRKTRARCQQQVKKHSLPNFIEKENQFN